MTRNLEDKIWLTAKSRIFAEKRYRHYDIVSHVFLSYMSVLIIISSILPDHASQAIKNLDFITVALSIALLVTSLIIAGLRFSTTADKHRGCYLKLQNLYQSLDDTTEPAKEYDKILNGFPNHSSRDYDDFVLDQTLFGKNKLTTDGVSISWDIWMLIRKALRFCTFWLAIFLPPTFILALFLWAVFLSQG